GGLGEERVLVDNADADARTIGRRLREIRVWRDKSLRVAAELAGISESYLSRIERGERTLDRRSLLEALATALRVAPSDITGQPYPPSNEAEALAHAAAQALRAVLRDIEVDELVTTIPPRSLAELRGEVAAVNAASAACDYGVLGQTVPDLVGELYALAEVNGSAEARRLLADVLHAAFYLSKDLGHGDLAWMVSGHLHATAAALGEPVLGAVAGFVRSHATVGMRARERGLRLAERSADLLKPDDGPAGQVYGMLHLSAALQSAVTGHADDARAHLHEAAETAGRTGDGTFAGLNFGPRNVGVWRVALALELGEPGRVPELARDVDVAAIPSAGRQATFYGDVGRGLAAIRGREAEAVEALQRAERLAPQRIRTSPFVREVVTDLLRRARRDAGGRELRGIAHRMGLAAS
ncbi:MAG: helix-turn-helix domain-containing protein, partial [Pseudonocardiaceae bacterium]